MTNEKAESNSEESATENIELKTSKIEKNDSSSSDLNKKLLSDNSARNIAAANIVDNPSRP